MTTINTVVGSTFLTLLPLRSVLDTDLRTIIKAIWSEIRKNKRGSLHIQKEWSTRVFHRKMENLFHRSSFEIDGFIYRFIGRFCYYYCERGKKRENVRSRSVYPWHESRASLKKTGENGNRFLINFQTKAVSKAVQKTDNSSLLPAGIHGIHRPRLALCPATKRTRLEIEIGREWNGQE